MLPLDLPQPGPFRVKRGYILGQLGKGSLWLLLLWALAAGALFYAGVLIRDHFQTSHIWKQGKPAQKLGYRGRVTTTNLILKEYRLTVRYRTQAGVVQRTRVEFTRFFFGPDKGSPYEVRYLPQQPHQATITWAYEALPHGWVWSGLMLILGLVGLGGGGALFFSMAKPALQLRRMARRGELLEAAIYDHAWIENPYTGRQELHLSYQFYRDKQLRGTYVGEEEPLLSQEETHIVLLFDPASGDQWVLERQGAPLDIS